MKTGSRSRSTPPKRVLGYEADNLQAYWLWSLAALDLSRFGEAEAVLEEALPAVLPTGIRSGCGF